MPRRWLNTFSAIGLLLVGACDAPSGASKADEAAKGEDEAPANRMGNAADPAAAATSQSRDGVPGPAEPEAKDEAPPSGIGKGLDNSGLRGMGHGAGPGLGNAKPTKPAPDGKTAPADREDKDKRLVEGGIAPSPASPPPMGRIPSTEAETAIDPNGRFATTYRPGGGHLAAFESAVAAGIVPESERELVADIGARYAADIAPPTDGALGFRADFERGQLAPSGGQVHLRLSLRSTDRPATARPQLSVVVVMDVSGSMRGKLIQAARDAASNLVDKLQPGDDFSLVTFSTEANVHVPMGKISAQREGLKKQIAEIREGGGTNIGEGLRLAYEQSMDKRINKDAVRVVLLLSDGRANEGITDSRRLSRLSLEAFQAGIQTSSFGLGTDYDGPLMSQIASDGAGGYYYLRDAAQVSPALATELDKRLDPVATAIEVRVRLKPTVDLLNVYGSRRLSAGEAERVRAIEVAQDAQTEAKTGIKQNRADDKEGGMRFFIPAFARDDRHSILLKLRLPEGVGEKDVALVELKYKDLVTKKNVVEENTLKLSYANSDAESARTIDPLVARTVQGFAAGEALRQAAELIGAGQPQRAVDLLGEREGLLHHAATMLGEPQFVEDAKRLARMRVHALGRGSLSDPLVVAMMMEAASSSRLH